MSQEFLLTLLLEVQNEIDSGIGEPLKGNLLIGSVCREFIIVLNSDWSSRYFIPKPCKRAAIFKYSNYESWTALAIVIPNDLRTCLILKGDALRVKIDDKS